MRYLDISVSLGDRTIHWEGDHPFEMKRTKSTSLGDPTTYNLSHFQMSVHLGTHIDAPLHFVHGGMDVAAIDLDALNGPARVVDLRGSGNRIDREILKGTSIGSEERILLKTDNAGLYEQGRFSRDFAHLTQDGAAYLRGRETRLVGIDYLSVDPWMGNDASFAYTAHHELFDPRDDGIAPTLVLETLDLRGIDDGEYELVCLPLRIEGAEGAPTRAILKKG